MFRKMTIALVAASGLLVAPVLAQNSPHELSGGSSKAPPSSQDTEKTEKTDKTEKLDRTEKTDTKSAEGSEEKSEKSGKSHTHKAASRHHHRHTAKREASRHGHSAVLMRHHVPRAYARARHARPGM